MSDEPDLFRLAFIPGAFRCPQCEFQLVKTAMNMERGVMGTTEKERMGEPCPNDGTELKMVTYRERVEEFDKAYTDAQQQIAELMAKLNREQLAEWLFLWNHPGEYEPPWEGAKRLAPTHPYTMRLVQNAYDQADELRRHLGIKETP